MYIYICIQYKFKFSYIYISYHLLILYIYITLFLVFWLMFKTSITPTNPNSFLKIGVCHGYHTAISFHLTPPSPPKEWGWVQAPQLQAQTCQPTKQRVVLLLDIHQRMATLDEERIHSHYICTINTCIPLVNLILRTSLACHMWDFLIDEMHIYIYIHWGIYIYIYIHWGIYIHEKYTYIYIYIYLYICIIMPYMPNFMSHVQTCIIYIEARDETRWTIVFEYLSQIEVENNSKNPSSGFIPLVNPILRTSDLLSFVRFVLGWRIIKETTACINLYIYVNILAKLHTNIDVWGKYIYICVICFIYMYINIYIYVLFENSNSGLGTDVWFLSRNKTKGHPGTSIYIYNVTIYIYITPILLFH